MYDSTNIVPKPVVTGVSALGYDHVNVLGKTLKEIGYQKGGIYKVSPQIHFFKYSSGLRLHRLVYLLSL